MKTKLISIFSISLFSILLFAVSQNIPEAAGHGNIDQSSPGPRTPGLANIVAAEIHGQSFKPTANNIIAVEVQVSRVGVVSDEPITIRIREGEGFGGTLLGSTQTHTGIPAPVESLIHFDFPDLIPLTPGNSYTFTVELNDPNDLFKIRLTRNGNEPYNDGTAFIVSQPESSDLIFNTFFDDSFQSQVIGGEIIPIDATSLLVSNAQSFSWMIPVVLSVLGIGLFVVSRKSE